MNERKIDMQQNCTRANTFYRTFVDPKFEYPILTQRALTVRVWHRPATSIRHCSHGVTLAGVQAPRSAAVHLGLASNVSFSRDLGQVTDDDGGGGGGEETAKCPADPRCVRPPFSVLPAPFPLFFSTDRRWTETCLLKIIHISNPCFLLKARTPCASTN